MFVVFVVICCSPILYLALTSFFSAAVNFPSSFKLMIPTGTRLVLLIRTLALSLSVATAGTLLGLLAASYLWQRPRTRFKTLRYLVWLVLLVPFHDYVLSWSVPFSRLNAGLMNAGPGSLTFQGFWAAWWVETLVFMPIAFLLGLSAFEAIDSSFIDAGRIFKSDLDVTLKVATPLVSSHVFSAWSFIFLLSLLNFSIPSLLLLKTYPLEIFARYSASHQPADAFLLAIPLLLIAFLVILGAQLGLKEFLGKTGKGSPWRTPAGLPGWVRSLQKGALLLVVIQLALPFVSAASMLPGLPAIKHCLVSSYDEFKHTVVIAALASLVSVPIGLAVALKLKKSTAAKLFLWFVVIIPLAVPPQLTGIGLIGIWNHQVSSFVYDSVAMPVLGNLARFMPIAVLVLYAWLNNLDILLLDAASVFQPSFIKRMTHVYVPLFAPGLLLSVLLVFVLSAGELATSLLVLPPGMNTITVKIYNYLHYGASATVAALCFPMLIIAAVCFIIMVGVLRRWERFAGSWR